MILIALSVPASVYQIETGLRTLLAGLFIFVMAFALLEPLFPALLLAGCMGALELAPDDSPTVLSRQIDRKSVV